MVIVVLGICAMVGVWELFDSAKWRINGDCMGVCVMFEWMIFILLLFLVVALFCEKNNTGAGQNR